MEVADALGSGPEDMDTDAVEIRRIPTEADFLMAYSVVPGKIKPLLTPQKKRSMTGLVQLKCSMIL